MKTKDLSLEKEKLEIIKWVTGLKDDTALEKLKILKDQPKRSDWWDEITDEERTAIDIGLDDVKAGRIKPHKEARKLYEKWL